MPILLLNHMEHQVINHIHQDLSPMVVPQPLIQELQALNPMELHLLVTLGSNHMEHLSRVFLLNRAMEVDQLLDTLEISLLLRHKVMVLPLSRDMGPHNKDMQLPLSKAILLNRVIPLNKAMVLPRVMERHPNKYLAVHPLKDMVPFQLKVITFLQPSSQAMVNLLLLLFSLCKQHTLHLLLICQRVGPMLMYNE